MMLDASIFQAFEKMPLPQLEFLDDSNLLLNCVFAGLLGGSVGVLLYVIITEIVRYLND
jgi:hypothetical protein